jgi:hypothetical protein
MLFAMSGCRRAKNKDLVRNSQFKEVPTQTRRVLHQREFPLHFSRKVGQEFKEGRGNTPYPPEAYLRVIDNLRQIFFEAKPIQQTNEQERGVNNTLFMVCLGLQLIAYDHLGPEGQVNFKGDLFSIIKSQDWAVQPVSPTMKLWQNSFELTVTQGKLLQRIAEGLNLTYDPGGQYDIAKRTFNYDAILQRPITKHPNDAIEHKPLLDSEIKAYLRAKQSLLK